MIEQVFHERHQDLMRALFFALRDGVKRGILDHRGVEPYLVEASRGTCAKVRKMLEATLRAIR
jgi:hypothetical protein